MRLEIRHLAKAFPPGRRRVIDDLSLDITFGHVLALLGPSGGGKSTLLRLIAGLDLPDEGEILIDGRRMPADEPSLRAHRTGLGVVFQAFNLFPHRTAIGNIELPLREVHGWDAARARARAMEMLDRLGLSGHAGKFPDQLSGGQRQRVAIARALAPGPGILLFDEPTSSLDPEMTAEVLSLIDGLRDSSTPMILVTHEMGFARKVADSVVFLAGGKVLESGPATTFFAEPSTPEAGAFLSNVLAY